MPTLCSFLSIFPLQKRKLRGRFEKKIRARQRRKLAGEMWLTRGRRRNQTGGDAAAAFLWLLERYDSTPHGHNRTNFWLSFGGTSLGTFQLSRREGKSFTFELVFFFNFFLSTNRAIALVIHNFRCFFAWFRFGGNFHFCNVNIYWIVDIVNLGLSEQYLNK